MIPRIQYASIKEKIINNRLLLLSGPRAVGKKEIVQQILTEANQDFLELNAAKKSVKKQFEEINETILREIFGDHRFVVLHEAQYIDKLQLIIEELLSGNWNVTLILTCSYEPVLDEILKEVLESAKLLAPYYHHCLFCCQ